MKCSEVNIWFDRAAFENEAQLPESIKDHINVCEICNSKFNTAQHTLSFLLDQREKSLSHEKKIEIIDLLVTKNEVKHTIKLSNTMWLARVAAVLVLAFGLLTGIILGGRFVSNTDDDSVWSSEFTMLSENIEYSLFE